MGIRASWGIAALLGVACLGEARYIVAHRATASSLPGREVMRPVLPIPAGADPNGFEVRKGKDEITLVFHKVAHAA